MKTVLIFMAMLSVSNGYGQLQNHFTPDGAYVWVAEDKSASMYDAPMMIIQSTQTDWKKEIAGITNGAFSSNGKYFLFRRNDSAYSLQLGTEIIAIQPGEINSELLLKKIGDSISLLWISAANKTGIKIWVGENGMVNNYVVDDKNHSVVFILHLEDSGHENNELWFYKEGMGRAEKLTDGLISATNFLAPPPPIGDGSSSPANSASPNANRFSSFSASTPHISNEFSSSATDALPIADEPIKFTADGKKILFTLKALPHKPRPGEGWADLWSYKDIREYSMQLADTGVRRRYAAVIDPGTRQIIRLEQENELLAGDYVLFGCPYCQINNQYALVIHFAGNIFSYGNPAEGVILEYYSMSEYSWNRMTETDVSLVSLQNGKKTLLKDHIRSRSANFPYYRFSPRERYVIYYDQDKKNYFTYEISSGITRCISAKIPVSLAEENPEAPAASYNQPCRIINWLDADKAVWVWDHYGDIWQLDPLAKIAPINITNGFARKNHAWLNRGRFELMHVENQSDEENHPLIFRYAVGTGQEGYGYLFDGIFIKDRYDKEMHELVPVGGKYRYQLLDYNISARLFLVLRSNAEEPPKSFYTKDFKSFEAVTGRESDRRIGKGVKKELLTWKTFDGTFCQGVLFKPKNFDPQKKYPVIVYYYEKKLANMDFQPYPPDNEVDVFFLPGYIYFMPDIHYKLGRPGHSVYNCVVSGAEFISRLPYVNAKKMGITGTSYGGFETNYLLAHTHLFAAAFTSCGFTDIISEYGFWDKSVRASTASVEIGQIRLGTTPWERPDLYLENSPVMYAAHITTPVLIAHNYDDPNVPFAQNVELYKALRRLGKPCWMLVGLGGHGGPRNTWMQFFDHYLKDEPCPKWMLGDSSVLPEINLFKNGQQNFQFEIDSTGRKPGPGLNYPDETHTPQQKELLKTRTRLNEHGMIIRQTK